MKVKSSDPGFEEIELTVFLISVYTNPHLFRIEIGDAEARAEVERQKELLAQLSH